MTVWVMLGEVGGWVEKKNPPVATLKVVRVIAQTGKDVRYRGWVLNVRNGLVFSFTVREGVNKKT